MTILLLVFVLLQNYFKIQSLHFSGTEYRSVLCMWCVVMSDQPVRHVGRRRGRRTGALSSSLLTVSVLVSIQCQIYLMRAFFDW